MRRIWYFVALNGDSFYFFAILTTYQQVAFGRVRRKSRILQITRIWGERL